MPCKVNCPNRFIHHTKCTEACDCDKLEIGRMYRATWTQHGIQMEIFFSPLEHEANGNTKGLYLAHGAATWQKVSLFTGPLNWVLASKGALGR